MTDLRLAETAAYGSDAGRGNLLGIEPYMVAADYASAATLRAKLDGYMQIARQRGWLNDRTLVGSW